MPTNTDLVTDLPADFEVFGQAVDTSLADLKGGTTGQILAKNTNADMDFVWQTAAPGDITGVTATTPLTGGGTSGDITVGIQDGTTAQKGAVQLENSTSSTSTTTAAVPASVKSAYDLANGAIPKSTVTTNGDLIYATGSSAVTRRGIGSSGQVLTVSGGVPTWATPASGGMTVIASGSLSSTSVTLSSIPATYNNLQLVIRNAQPSTGTPVRIRLNGDSGTNYFFTSLNAVNVQTFDSTNFLVGPANDSSTSQSSMVANFWDYTNTTTWKLIEETFIVNRNGDATKFDIGVRLCAWAASSASAAINQIEMYLDSGYTYSGGTYILYGVK